MKGLLLGFILMSLVMLGALEKGNLQGYLQAHSLIIVLGGSIAIMVVANPIGVLKSILRSLKILSQRERDFNENKVSLMELMKSRKLSSPCDDPLILYGVDLWEQGVDPDLFIVLVSQKKRELESKTLDAVQALKNLAKYPPALGMLGTVIGMISLFAKLDQNKDHLGTSLSMAMTATFLGLILTNGIISPLADRLHVHHLQEQRYLENIYEILLLINRDEPMSLIREEMNHRAA